LISPIEAAAVATWPATFRRRRPAVAPVLEDDRERDAPRRLSVRREPDKPRVRRGLVDFRRAGLAGDSAAVILQQPPVPFRTASRRYEASVRAVGAVTNDVAIVVCCAPAWAIADSAVLTPAASAARRPAAA
jgi:hypothetical protein